MTERAIDKIIEELENQAKQAKQDMADARQYGVNSAGFNAYMGRMEMAEQILEEARRLALEEAKEKPTPYYVTDEVLAAYLAQGITALYGRPLVPYEKIPPTAPASLVGKWHDLKVMSPYWEALRDDVKPFEIRKNDRGYVVGDGLALRHWAKGEYVVNEAPQYFVVKYVTNFPDGIKPGYVALGISRYRPSTQADIVGELKECLSGDNDYFMHLNGEAMKNRAFIPKKMIEEIIAKHEGAK